MFTAIGSVMKRHAATSMLLFSTLLVAPPLALADIESGRPELPAERPVAPAEEKFHQDCARCGERISRLIAAGREEWHYH
ncbi:hypothetical protein PA01_19170 [Azoarcus sp. PA01]|nr:hypothetical protein PA01_19170 [Azoarcus sp. PA01]